MADLEKIGGYAFLLGVVIAVIAGLLVSLEAVAANAAWITLVLVILGLIVGFLNIKDKQVTNFLVAAIALLALSISAGGLVSLGTVEVLIPLAAVLVAMVGNVAVFVMPAALIVALKEVYNIASGK
ncbi:MAG: hypothetical protein J4415_02250 [Candidatus Diapherotrites archaeon]|uniref:Uncharacterized protein n=1 Tax=Candidatus Iainarchaeum sp. TaxID=3101447 RepID=A0A8T4L2X3_9ARCH|nr:hypothetical protein [Candidatus Diapherotrites archaeon]